MKLPLSLLFLSLGLAASAQSSDSTGRTTIVKANADTAVTTTARTFGGAHQFKRFSIGVNAGAVSPALATGGSFNDFSDYKVNIGYGVDLRWQLTHRIGIQLNAQGGKVSGNNSSEPNQVRYYDNVGYSTIGVTGYDSRFWSGTLSAVFNVLDLDFLHRKNGINFFTSVGGGMVWYHPELHLNGDYGQAFQYFDAPGTRYHVRTLLIPVGAGVKFKLSDAVQFVLGYTENFTDDDNMDGVKANYPTRDHYSYGYGGFEFTLGSKNKPNLDWVNPVAMMYDELYDAALRQEVEALKGRVTNVENAVNDLKKDSDGDGVSDQFDKCPNTPAGTVVDGAGCEIKFPKVADSTATGTGAAYSNIQFDFDSSVLRTSSYPVLDATSADLRSGTSKRIELDGYASSEGTAAHNMKLSRDRAQSVKTYLVNSGVEARRVRVKAYGETHPIADNSTEEGRIQNRRVEFKQK